LGNVRLSSIVRREIDLIAADHLSGSGNISRRALSVLRMSARRSLASNPTNLLEELKSICYALAQIHPTMIQLMNMTAHALSLIRRKAQTVETVDELRKYVEIIILRITRAQSRASRVLAVQASRLITTGDCIGTASYSQTFIQLCKAASDQGKHFRVLAAESEFQGRSYGVHTSAQLQSEGIDTVMVPDLHLHRGMREAQRFIVGADAIFPDGSIINGQPSLSLAMLAFQNGIPFYAVCDSTKIGPTTSNRIEDGFDMVPRGLITAVMTESGPVSHKELSRLSARSARWRTVMG
jgi:translation initiation factor 2B subunit (eIF-2B alpha/beta/delta family)